MNYLASKIPCFKYILKIRNNCISWLCSYSHYNLKNDFSITKSRLCFVHKRECFDILCTSTDEKFNCYFFEFVSRQIMYLSNRRWFLKICITVLEFLGIRFQILEFSRMIFIRAIVRRQQDEYRSWPGNDCIC